MRFNRATRTSVRLWILVALFAFLLFPLTLGAYEVSVFDTESSAVATNRIAQGGDADWNQVPQEGTGSDTQWGPGWNRGRGWGGWGGGHFGPMPMSPWATPWVWIIGVLLVAVLVVGLVLILRGSGRGGSGSASRGGGSDDSPDHKGWEEVLKERYARGEISREEYREMRDELNDRSS